MKTRSIFFSLLFAAIAFASLTNCSSRNDEGATESAAANETEKALEPSVAEAGQPQFQVDKSFQEQLSRLFSAYVKLKDAFYSSDAGKVKEEASHTSQALERVDMKLLSGAAHHDWMSYFPAIQASLKEIESGNDMERQKKSFSTLSDNLYKSIRAFGLGGQDAYYDYCPMAFNNEGAYWLTDRKEIKNPYFGEKMPACGQVKEKFN